MMRDIDRAFLRDISRDVVAFERSIGMEPSVKDMLDDTFGVAQTEFTNYLMRIALADRKITNEEIAVISTSLERRLTQENIEEMVYDGSNNASLTAAVWADNRAQGATSKAKKLIELYKTAGTELVFCDVANSQISSYNTKEKSHCQKSYIQEMLDYNQKHNKYVTYDRDDLGDLGKAEFEHKGSGVTAPAKRLFERIKDLFNNNGYSSTDRKEAVAPVLSSYVDETNDIKEELKKSCAEAISIALQVHIHSRVDKPYTSFLERVDFLKDVLEESYSKAISATLQLNHEKIVDKEFADNALVSSLVNYLTYLSAFDGKSTRTEAAIISRLKGEHTTPEELESDIRDNWDYFANFGQKIPSTIFAAIDCDRDLWNSGERKKSFAIGVWDVFCVTGILMLYATGTFDEVKKNRADEYLGMLSLFITKYSDLAALTWNADVD